MNDIPRHLRPPVGRLLYMVGEYGDPYLLSAAVNALWSDNQLSNVEFLSATDAAIRICLASGWMWCEGIAEWETPHAAWRAMPEVLHVYMILYKDVWFYANPELNGIGGPSLNITPAGSRMRDS